MFSTKMACNCLFKLGLSLGVGLSNVFAIMPVLAAPAPLFEPILDELATATELVRLPAFVPADVELYPFIRQRYPGLHILNVGVTPECKAESCLGFNIVTASEPSSWPPPEEDRLLPLTSVVLGNGIQGYYAEAGGFGRVEWIQDGWLYTLIYRQELFSYEDAMAMATSMTSEPPVSTTQ